MKVGMYSKDGKLTFIIPPIVSPGYEPSGWTREETRDEILAHLDVTLARIRRAVCAQIGAW